MVDDSRKYCLAIIVLLFAMQLLPVSAQEWMLYRQGIILSGEWWRLMSAHFVHLSWPHFWLNAMGLAVLAVLFRPTFGWRLWLLSLLLLPLSISLGLLLASPEIEWFGGFSGVLIGLFVQAALLNFSKDRVVAVATLLVIGGDIAWEQVSGQLLAPSAFIGADVVVDSHFYGALTACLIIALVKGYGAFRRSEKRK